MPCDLPLLTDLFVHSISYGPSLPSGCSLAVLMEQSRGITFLHFFFLGLIIILTPTRIGSWFNSFAIYLRSMGAGGMAILALMVGA